MLTPEYTQENLLKKVHIGETDYYFKDEDLRNFVESFGTSVSKDAVNRITSEGTNVPTEEGVVDYIDNAVRPDINSKASVSLDNDEGLVFNYIPYFGPGPGELENPVEISFVANPNQSSEDLAAINVELDELPSAYDVESGTTIANAHLPELRSWHRTGEPPWSGEIVANWVTDPDNPSSTIVDVTDETTTIDADLTLYTYFEQVFAM